MALSDKFGLTEISTFTDTHFDSIDISSSDNQIIQQLKDILQQSYPIKKIKESLGISVDFQKRRDGWSGPAYYAPEAAHTLISILLESGWEPFSIDTDFPHCRYYFRKSY